MIEATILIIDDHPLFADGFRAMSGQLRPRWRIEHVATAAQALAAVRDVRLDLVVVDVFLADEDGFALSQAIFELRPSLPQLIISGREDVPIRIRARSSKARGFIGKTARAEELVRGIDTLLAGGAWFEDAEALPLIPVLTARQIQILDLLAGGHGNKEIRYRLGIAERTIRAHLTDLFQQLGAHSRMQAVVRARALGLIP